MLSRGRVRHALRGAIILFGGVFLPLGPAAAQVESQLSVTATKQWANVDRVLNPAGVTAGFTVFPVPVASVRVTWTGLWGASEYPQTFCDEYWPRYLNCSQEPATHRTSVRRLEVGAAINPRLGNGWRLALGVGSGWTWLHASGSSLTTGRPEAAILTASSHGGAVWAGVDRRLDRSGRFGASLEIHRIVGEDLDACATDVAIPFCHTLRATSIRVGITLRLESGARHRSLNAQPNPRLLRTGP